MASPSRSVTQLGSRQVRSPIRSAYWFSNSLPQPTDEELVELDETDNGDEVEDLDDMKDEDEKDLKEGANEEYETEEDDKAKGTKDKEEAMEN